MVLWRCGGRRTALPLSFHGPAVLVAALLPRAVARLDLTGCRKSSKFFRESASSQARDTPCEEKTVSVTDAGSGKFLFACEHHDAWLCHGDGSGSSASVCTKVVGKLGCQKVWDTTFFNSFSTVYAACGDSVSRCDWDSGTGTAANCGKVSGAECPGHILGAAEKRGVLRLNENTLLVACAGAPALAVGPEGGLFTCNFAPGHIAISNCTNTDNPCKDVHGNPFNAGLSWDADGRLVVGCMTRGYAYCNYSSSMRVSGCISKPQPLTCVASLWSLRSLSALAELPSGSPSASPTMAPSVPPTTARPSSTPSQFPSAEPSTASPSVSPSRGPSRSPWSGPSQTPTAYPSGVPTSAPSANGQSILPSRPPTGSAGAPPTRPSGAPSRAAPTPPGSTRSPSVRSRAPSTSPSESPAAGLLPTGSPDRSTGSPIAASSSSPSSSPAGSAVPSTGAPSRASVSATPSLQPPSPHLDTNSPSPTLPPPLQSSPPIPPPQSKRETVAENIGGTGTEALAPSLTAGLGGGALGMGQTAMGFDIACDKLGTFQTLPRALHPTQLEVWGSKYLGCVVGSLCIVAGVAVLSYAAVAMLRRWDVDGDGLLSKEEVNETCLRCIPFVKKADSFDLAAVARHPNGIVSAIFYVYQGVSFSALRLTIGPNEKPWLRAIGAVVSLITLGFPFWVWRIVSAGVTKPPPSGGRPSESTGPLARVRRWDKPQPPVVLQYLLLSELGDWVSCQRKPHWVNSWQTMVRRFVAERAAAAAAVELLASWLLALVNAPGTDSNAKCGHVRLAAGVVYFGQLLFYCIACPFRSVRETTLHIVLLASLTAAMLVLAHDFYTGERNHRTVVAMLEASTGVILGRAGLHILGEGLLLARGWRSNSQMLEFGGSRDDDSDITDTFAEKGFSDEGADLPPGSVWDPQSQPLWGLLQRPVMRSAADGTSPGTRQPVAADRHSGVELQPVSLLPPTTAHGMRPQPVSPPARPCSPPAPCGLAGPALQRRHTVPAAGGGQRRQRDVAAAMLRDLDAQLWRGVHTGRQLDAAVRARRALAFAAGLGESPPSLPLRDRARTGNCGGASAFDRLQEPLLPQGDSGATSQRMALPYSSGPGGASTASRSALL
eukprot:TRINITY_DN27135_c1_g2_i2.p1 TRINITY_DN27135_c1_g2~~TRINITY_DN27135_c1_g2_i2.p1  ORF type:complete len:1137 (+),score=84.87 TRINITY_DN27135_c1_g2_i2:68-3412(+)